MSDKFFALNREDVHNTSSVVTRGVATSATKHMELRIPDGAGVTKEEIEMFFERLENYFVCEQTVSNSVSDLDL